MFQYDILLNPVQSLFVVPLFALKTKNTPEYKVPPHFQWSEQHLGDGAQIGSFRGRMLN